MDRLLEIVVFWLCIVVGLYTLAHGLVLGEALESGDVYWATAEQIKWRLVAAMIVSPTCFIAAIGFEIRNLRLDRKEREWQNREATHSRPEPAKRARSATRKSVAESATASSPQPTSVS